MSAEVVVGIDLGTTNSEVAYVRNGQPVVVEVGGDRGIVPSCVGLDSGGRLVVGREARNQLAVAPERTIASIKRRMGSDERVALGEQSCSPQEVSAFILRELAVRASREIGTAVSKAVVTVPAWFSDAQRQATREAGAIAGLDVLRILNEPTAAALLYESGVARGASTVLVYDLGGGTFDVSIVRMEGGVVEVLASHGDTHLGGDDFDELILKHLVAEVEGSLKLDVTGDRLRLARLRRAAEAAKIELSSRPVTRVAEDHLGEVNGRAVHLELELSRSEFTELIEDALSRSLISVSEALRSAGLAPSRLDRVLLVGGSTRIPRVAEMLRGRLGQEPHGELDPELSVALGAAVQAGMEMGLRMRSVLVEITPHSFGTSVLGELNGRPSDSQYVPLIRRNTRLPAERSDLFFTVHEQQESVDVEVYQGEQPDVRDNIHVARFHFSGLNQQPEFRRQGLLFTYRLDLDGVLEVTALERASGREIRARVENALGRLGEAELAAARARVDVLAGATAEAGATSGDEAAVLRATPAGGLPAPFSELLARAESLVGGATTEDAADIRRLADSLRAAVAVGDLPGAEVYRLELEEILFYLE